MNDCPFCRLQKDRLVCGDDLCVGCSDRYPVTPGHTLILPRRHVVSFRDMNEAEWVSAFRMIRELSARLKAEDEAIRGFNVGINDGTEAGQTVMHAHIHLIPRRTRDVADPTGGVRGVIPGRARYGTDTGKGSEKG